MLIRSLIGGRVREDSNRRDRKRGNARRRNRLLRHEGLEQRQLLAVYANTTETPIPDPGTITSQINVSDEAIIQDLNVQLTIQHTRAEDLDVYLIAPDGTRIELFSDVGGRGENFTNTTLDDEAATSIADASPPFTGVFRPEGDLSIVEGKNVAGTWTLEVTDDKRREAGVLQEWSIAVEMSGAVESDFLDTNPMMLGNAGANYSQSNYFGKDVIVADTGDAMAVWLESERTNDVGPWRVMAAMYDAGTATWDSPVIVSNSAFSGNAWYLDVAADGRGNYLVVWQQDGDIGGFDLWANRYLDGQGWQAPERIDTGVGWYAYSRSIAMAYDPITEVTRGVVMWDESGLLVRRLTDFHANTWASPESVASLAGYGNANGIAMAPNGDFLTVFQNDSSDLYYRFYDSDSGWTSQEALLETRPEVTSSELVVAMNRSGISMVAWTQKTGEDTFALWARRWNGVSWDTAAEEVADGPAGGALRSPRVAIDENGEAVVLWTQRRDGTVYKDAFVRHHSGTQWETIDGSPAIIRLSHEGMGDVGAGSYGTRNPNLAIAMDDAGNAIASWTQSDETNINLWAARFDRASSTWVTAEKIEDAPLDALRPVVAMNGSGDNQVVWMQSDGFLNHIYAATIPEPGNLPPTAVDDVLAEISEDTSRTVEKAALLSNDFDPDGDAISITGFGTPDNGALVDNGDGTITYTPDQDYNGTDTFTYTISDGNGGTDTATVSILVSGVDDLPVADAGGPYTVVVGGTVQLDASASTDPDLPYGDSLTYAWDFDSDNVFDDAFDVSPTFDAAGLAEGTVVDVMVEVTDSTGNTSTAATTITVSPAVAAGMHVGDLDGTSSSVNRVKWAATVTILVEDGSGLPVSSATVQGTWSHGISSTASTDANGLATVSSGNVDKSTGSVSFQVISITHTIHEYDPAANTDPDEDSDGTSIVVYQDGSTAAPTSTVGETQSTASEPLISGTTSSMTEEPVADDNLFIEQHTAPADEADTEEPVSSASVDEALIDLDLDVLTDQLLDDLALTVL